MIVNRLLEKINRAIPHRVHSKRQIAMASDENDRRVGRDAAEFLLKLKSVHPRQENISYDTIKFVRIGRRENFFRSCVRNNLETGGAELKDQCPSRPLVIFNYRDPDSIGCTGSFAVLSIFGAAPLWSDSSSRHRRFSQPGLLAEREEIVGTLTGLRQIDFIGTILVLREQ